MWSERSGLWKTSIKTLLSFPALLPFLRKCVELMPAMGSGGIHQQLLTERLIVKKNYILFLQHAMSYECGNLFLSGTNLSGLEDVLKIMLDGIVFETDPQGERAKRASLDEDENTSNYLTNIIELNSFSHLLRSAQCGKHACCSSRAWSSCGARGTVRAY